MGIIISIIIIGILVTVHELGHFLAAKYTGMRVDEFAIGFGPALWKKEKGETLYSLRLVPLGGYNKIAGMDPDDPVDERGFKSKSIGARILVVVAGAAMNFLCGAFTFAIIYFIWRDAGLFGSLWGGFLHMIKVSLWMLSGLWAIITGAAPADLAGPIGVVMATGDVAARGMRALLNFFAFLSINLGLINLLPLPALDGGHFVLLILEGIRGKALPDKAMEYIQAAGIGIIIVITVFSTYKDLLRLW